MNTNNFHQKSNFTAGGSLFDKSTYYLTSVNIPGLSLSPIEVGGRGSSKMQLSPDTITWSPLTFDVLIDEDFEVYKEINDIFRKNIKADGTFEDLYFDFWVEVSNNKGNKIMKLDFTNCRLTSISDIFMDTQDDTTEHTLSIDLIYDTYDIDYIKAPTALT
jgi:hypothetical protein